MKHPDKIHEIHIFIPDKLYEQFKHISYNEGFAVQKLVKILMEQYVEDYYRKKRNVG